MHLLIKDWKVIYQSKDTKAIEEGATYLYVEWNWDYAEWDYIDDQLVEPQEKITERWVKQAYDVFNETLSPISSKYNELERATFDLKKKEADKYLEDNTYISPFLSWLLVEWETMDELVSKIQTNATNYQMLYASAEKQLREDLKALWL